MSIKGRFLFVAVLAIIPVAHAVSIGGADGLTVLLEPGGGYIISVPRLSWTFAGSLGAAAANVQVVNGSDRLGPYSEVAFDFVTDATRHASIRTYWDRTEVLFAVRNSTAAANTFTFPNLRQYPANMNHLSYSGTFAPPTFRDLVPESPWVFFDDSGNTFILSPAANFMTAANTKGAHGELASGISTQIAALPQDFQHQTLLVVGKGINRTFDTWGQALTTLYGKTRPANDADITLRKAGYWTDNGATYYYHMEPSMNYEQTLAAVKGNFDRLGITMGYLQLDSWFYPKGAGALWSNNGQGIYQYIAATPPFAAGLARFQQNLGAPLVTHARWIDTASPYRRTYTVSGNVVLDRKYWDSVAAYLAGSGVATYEQDWLNDNAQAAFNLTDGDTFLDNMAAAMAERNLTMQYCMASARHFLQSAKYGNLTTIRTSADRMSRDKWSDFMYTSRLASAVGAWPFTDNFLSTEATHMLIATLSAGPVGIGDAIGAIHGVNLKRAVRKDGVIVKPDVPLAPIEASFLSMAHAVDTPQIAATYSDFGALRTNYVFAYTQGSNTAVKLRPSEVGAAGAVYVYDYATGKGQAIDAADTVSGNIPGDAMYAVVAPIGPSGMAVIGDADQFVTMGKKRVPAIADDGTIRMTVAFAEGEASRVITGFSPWLPAAHALEGAVSKVEYNRASQQFRITLTPGASAKASVHILRAPRKTPSHGLTGTAQ